MNQTAKLFHDPPESIKQQLWQNMNNGKYTMIKSLVRANVKDPGFVASNQVYANGECTRVR